MKLSEGQKSFTNLPDGFVDHALPGPKRSGRNPSHKNQNGTLMDINELMVGANPDLLTYSIILLINGLVVGWFMRTLFLSRIHETFSKSFDESEETSMPIIEHHIYSGRTPPWGLDEFPGNHRKRMEFIREAQDKASDLIVGSTILVGACGIMALIGFLGLVIYMTQYMTLYG